MTDPTQASTNADVQKDQETLMAITREMAEAQNADQIMRTWAQDVIWFDITARFLTGYDAVHAEFTEQFDKLESCKADFIELGCVVSGDLGIVHSVQNFRAVTKGDGPDHSLVTRQTDCFQRRAGEWKLTHQHISLPIGG